MLSLVVFVLLAMFLAAFIWFLHRNQRRRTMETADRTAPLPVLEDVELQELVEAAPSVPVSASRDVSPPPPPASVTTADTSDASEAVAAEGWLARIKSMRDARQLDEALQLCGLYYPRAQAFQQAALILRQQIRLKQERLEPADALLQELHHTAALADLFRNSNPYKAVDPQAALKNLRTFRFSYDSIGYSQLKLLNKGDVRAMEQLWGNPAVHCHAEEVLGSEWITLCASGGELQP